MRRRGQAGNRDRVLSGHSRRRPSRQERPRRSADDSTGLVNSFIAADRDAYELAFTILTDYKVAVGISKNNKDSRQAVFDAIKIFKANGTEKQLYAKYNFNYAQSLPAEILAK